MNRWVCAAMISGVVFQAAVGTVFAGPAESVDLYEKGVQLQHEGKVDEAIQAYRRALYEDMSNRDAMYAVGAAYYEKGDYEAAEKAFREYLAFAPDDFRARSLLARIQLTSGEASDAKKNLLKIHALFPQDVSTLIGLAQAEQALGNRFAGEDYLKRALAVQPDNRDIQYMVRDARAANKAYVEAVETEKRRRILAKFNEALWEASKKWAGRQTASAGAGIERSPRPLPRGLTTSRGGFSIGAGRLIPYPTVGVSGTQIQLVPTGTHLRVYPR